MVRITTPEGRHHWTIDKTVAIGFFPCRIARMKTVFDRLRVHHAQILCHISVYRRTQFLGSNVSSELHARDLGLGMNACVCSPRSVYGDILTVDKRKGAGQLTLHGS